MDPLQRADNVGLVLTQLQGSMRRSLSCCCAACLHQPDVLWLWRPGPQRLVGALAFLPGLWRQPAPRP